MSVISSMYTGASGLSAHGDAMQVVGDNIANSNTIGYKGSRANFADVLARSIGGNEIGLGAKLDNVQKILNQGALLGTGVSTDLAISGDGFFQVNGNSDGLSGAFFTRAGQFKVDKDGFLVTQNGLNLQGYNADESGNIIQQVTDLKVPSFELPPTATTSANVVANLSSDEATNTIFPATTPWDPTNPTGTSNFSTSMTVYDSLGKAHNVTLYFRREANVATGQNWTYHAMVDGGEITGGTAGVPVEGATGALTFDAQGRLLTESQTLNDFDFINATQNQAITFDFGDSITTDGGTGLQGMTNYASQNAVSFQSQNGSSSGALAGISIDPNGEIQGVFTNGKTQSVGRVLVADFTNAQDLSRVGGNLFITTNESGDPLIGDAGTGGRGAINSGTLEQSNVDLATEFVNMIAFQRGYQASSRIITTADSVLQETVNLKR
ncbi:MAG: flagellar biosynthesis protein FlgE [Proteobacteria bacterium]|nr:MAG: flagellar biosynthesis protein FlgE [Pseudomonadota bacterium]